MSTQSILERAPARRAQEAERALETPHPATPSLRNFGEKALKKVKLDTDCEAEFRTYIETPNQDERNVMQSLHTLQLESLLNKSLQTHISTWKSSPALLNTMRKFIWAMLLLPNVAYYAGTNENTIIYIHSHIRFRKQCVKAIFLTSPQRPADFDMPTNDDDPETPRAQPDDDTEDPEPAGWNATD
ncbi:hypothetical protein DFH08DRAFT_826939 [Mycena albidolilacea]|uniref:Uncharacterized protein n=1 Tax=Mycena albidolilacea TaxID=1033008 RepID=A0AAD7E7T5_9AGAR|nr:hypothetical protein DFH08DRAFT_826939 [Mycena albidolilacea]